jgi:hypothetical protein
MMSTGLKHNSHYILPAWPPLALGVGIGLHSLFDRLNKFAKWDPTRSNLVLGALFLFQGVAILNSFPYNFTYENPLMRATRDITRDQVMGYGEVLEQAAGYLAQKPHAAELGVMSWYGIGPFSYYFPGHTKWVFVTEEWTVDDNADLAERDYLVIYISQIQRNLPPTLLAALEFETPEKVISYQGHEYVFIYKVTPELLDRLGYRP